MKVVKVGAMRNYGGAKERLSCLIKTSSVITKGNLSINKITVKNVFTEVTGSNRQSLQNVNVICRVLFDRSQRNYSK